MFGNDQVTVPEHRPAQQLRVMIVEDDALIAMVLGEVLVGMGHEICAIEATETGAVEAACRCAPDVMVIDAGLAEGSGLRAIERILETRFIPHILVSGDNFDRHRLHRRAVVLRKPYSETDLVGAIARAMAV